jgi:NAD(P)-dependent dehydrogenase (short-subunit alcohol dehydrogenase family)
MKLGASTINTASEQADETSPQLLSYAATKGAIQIFSAVLSQQLANQGIGVNTVEPGTYLGAARRLGPAPRASRNLRPRRADWPSRAAQELAPATFGSQATRRAT